MARCGCRAQSVTCEEIQACVGCPVQGSPTVDVDGSCQASVVLSGDAQNALVQGTDGGLYVPPPPAPGDFSCAALDSCSVSSMGDVDAGAPNLGDALVFDGTNWVPQSLDPLKNHAYRRRTRAADIAIPNNAVTTLSWPDEGENVIEGNEIQYASGVFTLNRAGRYQIDAGIPWAPNATGRRELRLLQNGTIMAVGTVPGNIQDLVTTQVHMTINVVTAPDTVQFDVFQTSGGSLAVAGSTLRNWVTIAFLND